MCGHDLTAPESRRRRISWVDVLLVVAVIGVIAFWWRIASRPQEEDGAEAATELIMPTNIPLMTATSVVPPTAEAVLVPTSTVVAPEVRTDGTLTHTVRSGENLLGIAGSYGVTVDDIKAANDMDDVLIRAGDELLIPIMQEAGGAQQAQVSSEFEYQVQSGDTVVSIATRFGSTVQDILLANNMSDNTLIRPGDVLAVPVRQVPSEVLSSSQDVTPEPDPDAQDLQFSPPPEDTVYIAPRLIGPADGAVLSREDAILLRWISVDVLDGNEWYVLLVYPVGGSAEGIPSIWTKSTSYRLEQDLAPEDGESAEYAWQVSVVRVQPGRNSQYALEAASPPSDLRSFTWK